jgi:2'-hydroxyisoflavone reductase
VLLPLGVLGVFLAAWETEVIHSLLDLETFAVPLPSEILDAGIQPWTDLPVWLPPGEAYDMMHQGNVAKALSAGLRCRSVQETVTDTWEWLQSIGGRAPQRPDRPAVGLDAETEAKFLRGRPG